MEDESRREANRWLLRALLDVARDLDLFYVPTRYPNGLESGVPADAFSASQSERALAGARAVVAAAGAAVG